MFTALNSKEIIPNQIAYFQDNSVATPVKITAPTVPKTIISELPKIVPALPQSKSREITKEINKILKNLSNDLSISGDHSKVITSTINQSVSIPATKEDSTCDSESVSAVTNKSQMHAVLNSLLVKQQEMKPQTRDTKTPLQPPKAPLQPPKALPGKKHDTENGMPHNTQLKSTQSDTPETLSNGAKKVKTRKFSTESLTKDNAVEHVVQVAEIPSNATTHGPVTVKNKPPKPPPKPRIFEEPFYDIVGQKKTKLNNNSTSDNPSKERNEIQGYYIPEKMESSGKSASKPKVPIKSVKVKNADLSIPKRPKGVTNQEKNMESDGTCDTLMSPTLAPSKSYDELHYAVSEIQLDSMPNHTHGAPVVKRSKSQKRNTKENSDTQMPSLTPSKSLTFLHYAVSEIQALDGTPDDKYVPHKAPIKGLMKRSKMWKVNTNKENSDAPMPSLTSSKSLTSLHYAVSEIQPDITSSGGGETTHHYVTLEPPIKRNTVKKPKKKVSLNLSEIDHCVSQEHNPVTESKKTSNGSQVKESGVNKTPKISNKPKSAGRAGVDKNPVYHTLQPPVYAEPIVKAFGKTAHPTSNNSTANMKSLVDKDLITGHIYNILELSTNENHEYNILEPTTTPLITSYQQHNIPSTQKDVQNKYQQQDLTITSIRPDLRIRSADTSSSSHEYQTLEPPMFTAESYPK